MSTVALLLPPQLTATLPHQLPTWALAFIPRSAESRLFVSPFSQMAGATVSRKNMAEHSSWCFFVDCFCRWPPSVGVCAHVMRLEIFWQEHLGGQKQKEKKYRYVRVVSGEVGG